VRLFLDAHVSARRIATALDPLMDKPEAIDTSTSHIGLRCVIR
jgi:hypothetical protein